MNGPVSSVLAAEVAAVVRRHGLVVWMDKHGDYTAFVDALAAGHARGAIDFPVFGWRGSFLELMLALEAYGNGLHRDRVLIHLPGYDHANIRATPLLEQYEAGSKFLKSIATLVTEAAAGHVGPEVIQRFVSEPGLTLAKADAWLAAQCAGTRTDAAMKLAACTSEQLVDGLLGEDRALLRELSPQDLPELAAHLERTLGLDGAWRDFFQVPTTGARDLESLATAFAGWILCVEYVTDLARDPYTPELRPLRRLAKPFAEQTLKLARTFRERFPKAYSSAADETEQRIPADAAGARAEELGKIDTFRFEEDRIREAAVAAARHGRWAEALDWADQRKGVAFWLDASPPKRWTWTIVHHAAAVGVAIEDAGAVFKPTVTLAEAVEAYATRGYLVDLAHRRFEQRHQEIMSGDVHDRDGLLAVIQAARHAYRDWADDLARAFTRVCLAQGFLPDEALQQRTLYDRVIAPMAREGERVAVFLVDAFRYEMAVELARELAGHGITIDLKPALAELPTITAVGMNVLAPVAQGQRLDPVWRAGDFDGFHAGEYQVRDTEARARAMGTRADAKPARQLALEKVGSTPLVELRAIVAKAPTLLLVHSRELDNAGEAGFGPATFERTLRQLRAAWNRLSQAGVKHFVFLSDHGFMLRDTTAKEVPYGRKSDPQRRHVVSEHDRAEPGMVSVPLSALRYKTTEEKYLLLREDTAVWKTTQPEQPFVHGGNSLQERVIPVLVVRRQRSAGTADTQYEVRAEALEDRYGRKRVRLQLRLAKTATGTLAFTGASYVTLGLRAKERPDVGVTISDVEGGAQLDAGSLRVPVREQWSTVYFSLEADETTPVQVEVFHPDGREKVEPCTIARWFEVDAPHRRPEAPTTPSVPDGTEAVARPASALPPPPKPVRRSPAWQDAIEDEGYRRALVHLDTFGTLSEAALGEILGSPRLVRTFARRIEEVAEHVPFGVRIESTGTMKIYVKESR